MKSKKIKKRKKINQLKQPKRKIINQKEKIEVTCILDLVQAHIVHHILLVVVIRRAEVVVTHQVKVVVTHLVEVVVTHQVEAVVTHQVEVVVVVTYQVEAVVT